MSDKVENVKVYIRIRPLKEDEPTQESKEIINIENQNTISFNKMGTWKTFKFCKVFGETSTQVDLYRGIAVPIVEKVLQGYNGTIFAYGQSGTGKTYTMIGDIRKAELKGIVPNIFSHIFAQISLANNDISYAVTVTYLEIYNEEIRDLLSDDPYRKLTVHEKPGLGVFVKDLLGFTVDSLDGITEILAKGNKNRAIGSTKLNDTSSRSHAIFTVQIESKNKVTNKTTFGKLNLVDLAGSERVAKTLATGDRLKEAGKINFSLSILGNVISALVDAKTSHVPYRSSKLTRLLQDSLGGNSLTAMIAMISPNITDCEESMYTLMYADRVRHIQNHVTLNTEKKSIIDTFENKIAELRQQLEILVYQEEREKKKEKKKSQSAINQEELDKIEMDKRILTNKIHIIQKKILIGGENLIEKAQQQLEMLENTAKELEHLDSSHQLLQEILNVREQEKNLVEQQYASLQDEDKELDKQIEEIEKQVVKAISVLQIKENEYQNEISTLLHTNKVMAREMGLVNFVIKSYVPKEYLEKVKSKVVWEDEIQEWQIKGVAYCGNNLRQQRYTASELEPNVTNVYRHYKTKRKQK